MSVTDGVSEWESFHPGVSPGGQVDVSHVDADLTHGGAGSLHAEHSHRTEEVRVGPAGGAFPGADIGHRLGLVGGLTGGDRKPGNFVLRLLGLHGGSEGVEVEVGGPGLEGLTAPEALVERLAAARPGEVSVGVGRPRAAWCDRPGAKLQSGHHEGRGLSGPVSVQWGRAHLPQGGAGSHFLKIHRLEIFILKSKLYQLQITAISL